MLLVSMQQASARGLQLLLLLSAPEHIFGFGGLTYVTPDTHHLNDPSQASLSASEFQDVNVRPVTANLYPVDVVNKETGQVDGTAYKYQFVPLGTARTINVYEAVFPSPPPPPPPPDGCCTVFPLGICSECTQYSCDKCCDLFCVNTPNPPPYPPSPPPFPPFSPSPPPSPPPPPPPSPYLVPHPLSFRFFLERMPRLQANRVIKSQIRASHTQNQRSISKRRITKYRAC